MEKRSPVPERTVPSVEWKIQKRSRTCVACNSLFAEGERYHSALRLREDCFQRFDYCCRCWAALEEEAKVLFSFWQGKYSIEEPPRKPEVVASSRAEDLFARLVQSPEPSSLKLAYVFALLLERRKKLVCKGRAERDGRAYVIYEHPGTGKAYMVEDVKIGLSESGSLQKDLDKILAGEGIGQVNEQ